MKKYIPILILVFLHFHSIAQDSTSLFPAADFKQQFQKLICSSNNNFTYLRDKQVVANGDTTWKSKLSLPGFKYANFSKSKSMIDYAFVAYQKFPSAADALNYYQEVKKAIDEYSGECVKLEPARIPVEVQGVEKYDLWKSIQPVEYNNRKNIMLYVSLNLDSENEVVINVFLKQGL
jgi:hypothetical protein